MKVCGRCGGAEHYSSGGCKACARARSTKTRINNKENVAAYKAQYRVVNKERIRAEKADYYQANKEKARAYYDANIETIKARGRADYMNDPAKYVAKRAKYYAENKEKIAEKLGKWREENKEAIRAYSSEYRKKHLDAIRIHNQNRRAMKEANGGVLSQGLAEKLFKLQRGKCACCGVRLGTKYHMDHIMPLVLGGANSDENIQLLRPTCNIKKKAKHPIDFMQSQGRLL